MRNISEKQRQIYDFISQETAKRGYPPSVREIAAAVGLKSPSTVHAHIKTLEEANLITKGEHKTRALSVNSASFARVPLLGHVTAGQPILAFEEILGYVPFEVQNVEDHFALKVIGDSMIDAAILDGDTIIVRKQSSARSGEIVVALLEDSATVKRLKLTQSGPWLMPENPLYEPIDAKEATILGKVVGVTRSF